MKNVAISHSLEEPLYCYLQDRSCITCLPPVNNFLHIPLTTSKLKGEGLPPFLESCATIMLCRVSKGAQGKFTTAQLCLYQPSKFWNTVTVNQHTSYSWARGKVCSKFFMWKVQRLSESGQPHGQNGLDWLKKSRTIFLELLFNKVLSNCVVSSHATDSLVLGSISRHSSACRYLSSLSVGGVGVVVVWWQFWAPRTVSTSLQ